MPRLLVLSGGGFRATLFHLGVIDYLQNEGKLESITDICAVSGGSITAAHLALNWDEYTSLEETIRRKPHNELMRFCGTNIRNPAIRQLLNSLILFPFSTSIKIPHRPLHKSIVGTLVREYDKLFCAKQLRDISPKSHSKNDRPTFWILATEMSRGDLMAIDSKGFNKYSTSSPTLKYIRDYAYSDFPLSMAVAASSAFPALFPPLQLSHEVFDDYDNKSISLGDGGIIDNTGMAFARAQFPSASELIVSDAGLRFTSFHEPSHPELPFDSMTRSIEIMQFRSELLQRAAFTGQLPNQTIISISQTYHFDDKASPPDSNQPYFSKIRTDFDNFSPLLISSLKRHGFYAAKMAYEQARTN